MASAQAGDQEAYRALLDDISAMLNGFLRLRLSRPEEAADALQDILLTVHRARHTYDPARPFDPWLFAIARHTVIDHLRRRERTARVEVLADDALPDVAVREAGGLRDIQEALAGLPRLQREAFEMLQLEGLSIDAAAARVGTSQGALKVRAHRAYRTIRQLLTKP